MLKTINPATGDLVAEYQEDSEVEILEKCQRARAAQPAWFQLGLSKRKQALTRFQELLLKEKDTAAKVLTTETGKPIGQARYEIGAVPKRIQFFLDNVERVMQTECVHEEDTLREEISQEPLGVVANISAWNYPYFVGSNVFVPALLTGNAVLYKGSEFAAGTGAVITRLLHEAGVPEDVFVPIVGGGSAGSSLLKQPLDGVFFTGSYATGQRIAESLAGRMLKLQMELGGKDPVYVCEDVEIAKAAAAVAEGAFYNTGQSCCAVERVYVHDTIIAPFILAFVDAVSKLTVGDPQDENTYMGPLTRPQQLQVLESQVADATAKGAKVWWGGRRRDGGGNFFEPTIISEVDHSMKIMREETFGPLIGIQSVQDDAEAVDCMNDTEYGLTAGVYTKQEERARTILTSVNSGTAYWNCCDRVSPPLPWSGRRHSGMGATLSLEGIRTFLQPKAWHLRKP